MARERDRSWIAGAGVRSRGESSKGKNGGNMKNSGSFLRVGLAMVLCLTITLMGCSTAWIGQAEEVVAALIPAATNIVALVAALQGKSVSAADLQTIQNAGTQAGADLQLIQSLITTYQTADATAQPGILNQIQTAIGAVQSNLQGLLPALHIQDAATQTKITAVVGIVLSEVQSLAAILPLANPSTSPAAIAKAAVVAKKKPPLTASQFVASYNATLTAKTGNAALDKATAGLEIHVHGKLARWASAGVLK
jgi:hypothetical protein